MNRREWLRRVSAAAAMPLLGGSLPAELAAWGREVHAAVAAQGTVASFDAGTMRLLGAVCERIIPADETPGAMAAGVPSFIDHMLANWYDATERVRVLAGLEELESRSRARTGRAFADASEGEQDAWLLELDGQRATSWFGTVKYLTIWGYYTSEAGVRQELGQGAAPGRYDGCAPYTPRTRSTSQPEAERAKPGGPHAAD